MKATTTTKKVDFEQFTLNEPVNELLELRQAIEELKARKNPFVESVENYFHNVRNSPLTTLSGLATGGAMMYEAYNNKDVMKAIEGFGLVFGLAGTNEKRNENVI